MIIFILAILIPTYLGKASKNDHFEKVKILEIRESSGFGGFEIMTSFSMDVIDENDNEFTVSVNIRMPNKFKKKIYLKLF